MPIPRRGLPIVGAFVAWTILVVGAGTHLFGERSPASVELAVSIPSDGRLPSGDVASLLVTLSTSASAVEPRFFIVLGPTVFAWEAGGPHTFEGTGSITYRIAAGCPDCMIPAGSSFRVRMYDVLAATYAFSPILRA